MDRMIGYRFRNLDRDAAHTILLIAYRLFGMRGLHDVLAFEPGDERVVMMLPLCERVALELDAEIKKRTSCCGEAYEVCISSNLLCTSSGWSSTNKTFGLYEHELQSMLDDFCVLAEEHVAISQGSTPKKHPCRVSLGKSVA